MNYPYIPMAFLDCKRKFPWYTTHGYPGELRVKALEVIPTTKIERKKHSHTSRGNPSADQICPAGRPKRTYRRSNFSLGKTANLIKCQRLLEYP